MHRCRQKRRTRATGSEVLIHLFQRTEKPGKATPAEPGWTTPTLAEISQPEPIRDSHNSCSHRPVFMRALSPGHTFGLIDPERERHRLPSWQHALPVGINVLPHLGLIVPLSIGK